MKPYTPDMPAALRKWAKREKAVGDAATPGPRSYPALLTYVDGLLDRAEEAGVRSGASIRSALQSEVAHLCDALGVTPEGVKE